MVGLPQRTSIPAGTGELTGRLNISVYPNPAVYRVTIECPSPAEIEILTVEGQLLKRMTTRDRSTTLDVSGFAQGIYIIRATTASGKTARKFRVGPAGNAQ